MLALYSYTKELWDLKEKESVLRQENEALKQENETLRKEIENLKKRSEQINWCYCCLIALC